MVVVVYCEEKGSENGSSFVVVVVFPDENDGLKNGSVCVLVYVSVVDEPKLQSSPVRFFCVSKLSDEPKSSCTESVSPPHKLDKSVVCWSEPELCHHVPSAVVSFGESEVSVTFELSNHHSSWLLLTAYTPARAEILQAA